MYSPISCFNPVFESGIFNLYNNICTINSIVNSYAAVNPYGIDDRILSSSKLAYVDYSYFYKISWRHCQFKLVELGHFPGSLRFMLNDKFLVFCQSEPGGFVPVCSSVYRDFLSSTPLSVKGHYDNFLQIPNIIDYCRLVTTERQFLDAVFNFLVADIKLG